MLLFVEYNKNKNILKICKKQENLFCYKHVEIPVFLQVDKTKCKSVTNILKY